MTEGHPAASAPRTPVHVLTGFLGSGKTTLLNRLLTDGDLADSAVVVNEFGDVSVDHLLVEHSEDRLVELPGGCVCCAVRGDLALTLVDLLARRARGRCAAFSRIIIETTGLADPRPVESLLAADPALVERVRLAGVLTTVDALAGSATLARFGEARRQVALADRLVLTKTDLLAGARSAPGRELMSTLGSLNPHAPVVTAAECSGAEAARRLGLLAGEGSRLAHAGRGDARGGPGEHGHHHHAGIETFTLVREQPLPGAALALLVEALAEHLGPALLRVKGLVDIEEAPGRPGVIQGAQHVFQPLDFLEAWPTDAPRCTRIVCITEAPARAWAEALLDAIVTETQDTGRRLARARAPGRAR